MSYGSNPPSFLSFSRVSEFRSIHEVISSLGTSFRDEDLREAERELGSREAKLRREKEDIEIILRERCDNAEAERHEMSLKVLKLEGERERLERECEANNCNLTDLARELSVAREKEEKANKRYGLMIKKVEELVEKLEREHSSYLEIQTTLTNERHHSRRKLREKEEENGGLVRENRELLDYKKMTMAQLEEHRRINQEKDERIKELVKMNEVLEKEKGQILNENEGFKAEKGEEDVRIEHMEKLVSKLETDVATWLHNVARDGKFDDTQVGNILSAVIMVLDSEGNGGIVSAVQPKVARILKFETEGSTETGPRNANSPMIIDIDSESDDETLHHQQSKRKLCIRDDNQVSSDDSLNPKLKVKKLNNLPYGYVKLEPSKSSTAQRSSVSSVRKCNEKGRGEGNSQDQCRSTEDDTISSPQVKKLLDTCRRSKGSNVLVK